MKSKAMECCHRSITRKWGWEIYK